MDNLVEQSENIVTGLYETLVKPELLYHNLFHTREVVDAVQEMIGKYELGEEDKTAVQIAAWWHDAGYLTGMPENHEQRSAEKAKSFLQKNNAPESLIKKVEGCILATRMPQRPLSVIEEILCDADLFHLGKSNFQESSKMLRKEIETITGRTLKGSEWRNSTIRLLETHQYFTPYAAEKLKEGKKINLEELKLKQEEKKLEKMKEKEILSEKIHSVNSPEKEKPTFNRPKRGIETMFRLTSRNHMDLSGMADNKANIMISVNSIIISVVLSVLLRSLEDMPHFIIPTLILLSVNIVTIIFSVLATRPNLTKGYFTREDIRLKKVNLLFFGNFHKVGWPDFDWGVKEMMNDKEYLYTSIAKDIYFLGVVLGKKYRLLRISYNIFMFGLIVSVLAFIIAFLLTPSAT